MRPVFAVKLALGALLVCATRSMSADTVQFQSGETPTALLEFYTSEGCSSCPPAETWLSRLKESPKLWKDFVPVAFHVDYWDYLGWKDLFAAKAYTQRQHAWAAHWRSRSVYTPGFVLDGKDWRGWSGGKELPHTSSKPAGALTARSEDGRQWRLQFQPSAGGASLSCDFHAALLGFDLISDVKAGENRGRKLEHDFVVLALAEVAAAREGGVLAGVLSLHSTSAVVPKRTALAAWVTPRQKPEPLQSLGGWLPAPTR